MKIEVSVKKNNNYRLQSVLKLLCKNNAVGIDASEITNNERIIKAIVNDNFNFSLLRESDDILFFHIV